MTNQATYRFGGPRVCENQVLNHKKALMRGREHTLVDSVKMQSLPEDKQCVHFAREVVPSPAGWQGERPTRKRQKNQTDNGLGGQRPIKRDEYMRIKRQ